MCLHNYRIETIHKLYLNERQYVACIEVRSCVRTTCALSWGVFSVPLRVIAREMYIIFAVYSLEAILSLS